LSERFWLSNADSHSPKDIELRKISKIWNSFNFRFLYKQNGILLSDLNGLKWELELDDQKRLKWSNSYLDELRKERIYGINGLSIDRSIYWLI
jgi:hypothetical protein